MKKSKGVSLGTVLKRQFKKDKGFRILFDERRFYLQVAHLITDLRARAGFSQAEVAKAASVSQPLIARLEKGDQQRVPTFDMIYRILKVLGYRLEVNIIRESKALIICALFFSLNTFFVSNLTVERDGKTMAFISCLRQNTVCTCLWF